MAPVATPPTFGLVDFHVAHDQQSHGNRGGVRTVDSREFRPATGVYSDDYGRLDVRSTGVERIRQVVYEYDGGSDVYDVVLLEDDDGEVTRADVENLYGPEGTVEGEAAVEAWLGDMGVDVNFGGEPPTRHATPRAAVDAGDAFAVDRFVVDVEDAYSGSFEVDGGEFAIADVTVIPKVDGSGNTKAEVSGSIFDSSGDEVGTFSRAVYDDGTVFNHSLNIDPDRQGQGIGTAFLDETEADLGATRFKLAAVGVGKYAWAARGYRLDTDGGSSLANTTRDTWIEAASRQAANLDMPQADYDRTIRVLDSWTADINSVYPADLLAVDDRFRDVFLNSPSWDGVLEVDRALAASGAPTISARDEPGAAAGVEEFDGGPDDVVMPDHVRAAALARQTAPATFGLVEFANPWHDEIGRFAPKGTGSKATGGVVDGESLFAGEEIGYKLSGPQQIVDNMTDEQIEALRADLDAYRYSDVLANKTLGSTFYEMPGKIRQAGFTADSVRNMPLGTALQVAYGFNSNSESYGDALMARLRFQTGFEGAPKGDVDALSAELSAAGITPEYAFSRMASGSWTLGSASHGGLGLQAAANGGSLEGHFDYEPRWKSNGEFIYSRFPKAFDAVVAGSRAASADALGGNQVKVYRGTTQQLPTGERVRVGLNPMSSWSTSRDEAASFAENMSRSREVPSFIVSATVSPDDVMSVSSATGIGSFREREIILGRSDLDADVELHREP